MPGSASALHPAIPLLSILLFPLLACTPQYFWPQEDVAEHEVNSPALAKRILVASRKSEFKESLIKRIEDAYQGRDVYIRVAGLKNLQEVHDSSYTAVVLINTCMAWDIDRNVQRFLKTNAARPGLIIVTTSGDGRWAPKSTSGYDAIACPSADSKVDEIAKKVMADLEKALAQAG